MKVNDGYDEKITNEEEDYVEIKNTHEKESLSSATMHNH